MKISASSSRFCFQLVAVAFSLVVFSCAAGAADTPQRSRIYVYDLRTHSSKLVFTADTTWEAPNWSPDGKYLISNSGGLIYKLVFKADGTVQTPEKLNVPHDYECNNDKGISPDGTKLAFSASRGDDGSEVFLADPAGTPTHDPRDVHIELKLVAIQNDKVAKSQKVLVQAIGGQGSMNVNSWAPDSMRFAYVTYEALP